MKENLARKLMDTVNAKIFDCEVMMAPSTPRSVKPLVVLIDLWICCIPYRKIVPPFTTLFTLICKVLHGDTGSPQEEVSIPFLSSTDTKQNSLL